jgi:hypothetical protein
VVKSASNLGLKETSSHASLLKSKRFSSLKMNTGLETEDLSSQQPLQAAGSATEKHIASLLSIC